MSDNSNVIYHVLELEGNTKVKPEQGQSQERLWVRAILNTDGHRKTKHKTIDPKLTTEKSQPTIRNNQGSLWRISSLLS